MTKPNIDSNPNQLAELMLLLTTNFSVIAAWGSDAEGVLYNTRCTAKFSSTELRQESVRTLKVNGKNRKNSSRKARVILHFVVTGVRVHSG